MKVPKTLLPIAFAGAVTAACGYGEHYHEEPEAETQPVPEDSQTNTTTNLDRRTVVALVGNCFEGDAYFAQAGYSDAQRIVELRKCMNVVLVRCGINDQIEDDYDLCMGGDNGAAYAGQIAANGSSICAPLGESVWTCPGYALDPLATNVGYAPIDNCEPYTAETDYVNLNKVLDETCAKVYAAL